SAVFSSDPDMPEAARIALRDPIALCDLVVKDFQFFEQHRGLHRVEASGQSEGDIVVFVAAPAVAADAAQLCCEIGVVGEDRAAIAVAAERLGREEARSG